MMRPIHDVTLETLHILMRHTLIVSISLLIKLGFIE